MRQIQLTQGQFAMVDDADYERVCAFKWHAHRKNKGRGFYAQTGYSAGGRQRSLLLHRFIMQAGRGEQVDHKNGNGLDCRRENLRFCTHSQNVHNTPAKKGYKGVVWVRKSLLWAASIMVEGHRFYLGNFSSEEDAARAYDAAAVELCGEFARLNFPGVCHTNPGALEDSLRARMAAILTDTASLVSDLKFVNARRQAAGKPLIELSVGT